MQNQKPASFSNIFFLILALLVFIFTVARAVCMDMTLDEAYSFHNVKKFWLAESLCTGNTHWINFLAIKAAVVLGLESTFQLRWFSLLSGGIFLGLGFLWVKTLSDFPIKLFGFCFALLNPYVLDYFSLARGYASALFFEALCLLFFITALNKKNRNFVFISLVFAGLSAVANYSFIYFFAGFSWIYFYTHYFKNGFSFFKSKDFYVDLIYVSGIILLIARALVFLINCSNDFVGAGTADFTKSLYVFVDSFIYGKLSLKENVLSVISVLFFILLMVGSGYGILNRKIHNHLLYFYSSGILVAVFCIVIFSHFCFNAVYPDYRSALLFFPLIAINITCFLGEILKPNFLRKTILYGISIILIVNFIFSLNFKNTFDFPNQADSKEAFNYLSSVKAKKVGICLELFGPFINYYQVSDKYKFPFVGELVNCYKPRGMDSSKTKLNEFDYLILFPPYNLSFYKYNKIKLKSEKFFLTTKILIVKVLKP